MKYEKFKNQNFARHHLYARAEMSQLLGELTEKKALEPEIRKLSVYGDLFGLEDTAENYYRFIKQLNAVEFFLDIHRNIEKNRQIKRLKNRISVKEVSYEG